MKRILFILFICCFISLPFTLKGQIVDDSTKQVFGPHTTSYTFENNIKYNQEEYYQVDTLLDDLHRYSLVEQDQKRSQNLGNIGTALRSILYQPSFSIGAYSGYEAYQAFRLKPEKIKYFDTKSPYSKLSAVFGGDRRSTVDVSYSRSDSTILNIGFNFHRISADKQIGNEIRNGDNQSLSTAYNVYARWRPSEKYQLLANLSRIKHRVNETGGVRPLTSGSLNNLFIADSATLWLAGAESQELHTNYHLYHQFKIGEALQIYHALDITNQTLTFRDFSLAEEGAFFESFLISDTETDDETKFSTILNEGGIKGIVGALYYNFYTKARQYKYDPKYLPAKGYNTEIYLGSFLRYSYKENWLKFEGEYLLGRDYKVKASFENPLINASYQRVRRQASLLSEDYFGNHYEWHNNFDPTNADQLKGMITWNREKYAIRPYLSLTNVTNHIYFNQMRRPQQANGSVQMVTPGVQLELTFFKNLHLEIDWAYTAVTGPSANLFRIPEWLGHGKVYYANFLFKRALQVQIGIDGHYQSSFRADAYDPITQQFYLQDAFAIPEYWLADAFINFKVGRARIFAKMVFANRGLNIDGYFTAPYYIGQPQVFDWGINWQFFD